MAEPQPEPFKGIGHWHAQAKEARDPGNVFGQLAELARTLSDRHQSAAEARLHAAEQALKDNDLDQAAQALRAAARNCGPNCKAEADGLRSIADALPVPGDQAKPKQRRGSEDTGSADALP